MSHRDTVIVTGGASGLGAAVARAVAKSGDHAVVLDRAEPPFEVEHVAVDLADGRAAEAAVREVAERRGLRAVVTGAGIDAPGPLGDIPAADWERVVMVNLLGTAAVVRAALPFLERGGGRVVTVASTLGLRAVSDATAYCASKFGVVGRDSPRWRGGAGCFRPAASRRTRGAGTWRRRPAGRRRERRAPP